MQPRRTFIEGRLPSPTARRSHGDRWHDDLSKKVSAAAIQRSGENIDGGHKPQGATVAAIDLELFLSALAQLRTKQEQELRGLGVL